MSNTSWIDWVEQIRAIAQNGITYAQDGFDLERYHQLKTIAHEMTARLTGAPVDQVDDYFLPEKGYTTPKIDLRGGVFKEGKILLVRERSDNCWALPGGWGDIGESPSKGVVREIFEESGFTANAIKLAAIRDAHQHPYHPRCPHHVYKLLFLCELTGGQATANLEISDIGFFDIQQLPELSRERTIKEDIHLLMNHAQNNHLPTEFD